MPLDSPTCFKQLQHLEQEGAVQQDLSSFGKKNCIYGHTDCAVVEIKGYKLTPLDRIGKTGAGVCVYTRSSIMARCLKDNRNI